MVPLPANIGEVDSKKGPGVIPYSNQTLVSAPFGFTSPCNIASSIFTGSAKIVRTSGREGEGEGEIEGETDIVGAANASP